MDFKKNTDFTELEQGDICFTTDVAKKPGVPSHAYVFMGWVEDGKTDYANVCDGQIQEYGNILHKRNISLSVSEKDKFSFFLENSYKIKNVNFIIETLDSQRAILLFYK